MTLFVTENHHLESLKLEYVPYSKHFSNRYHELVIKSHFATNIIAAFLAKLPPVDRETLVGFEATGGVTEEPGAGGVLRLW